MKVLTYGVYIVALAISGITRANAQQTLKIGTNPTIVTNGAVLDIEASNKGALLPRVALTGTNDVSTIASPANALTVFNTATTTTGTNDVVPGYYYWSTSTSKWIAISNQDLRHVGRNNHITNDAGAGSNGTSIGTGANNTAIGWGVLTRNISGENNQAHGVVSLYNNTTGSNNIGIGGGNLYNNVTGNDNVSLGLNSLRNTTGNKNVALGRESGYYLTAGDGNVFLGNLSGPISSTTLSDQLFIDNKRGDDALIRGDFAAKVLTVNGNTTSTAASPSKTSTLNVNGSVSASITTVNANYTATDTDYTIVVKAIANGDVTISLPSAAANKGRLYYIVGFGGSYSGNLNVTARTPFAASYTNGLNSSVTVQSDGTEWLAIKL